MNNTGFIYKLVSKDIEVKECYVGSTGNTRMRKCKHKHDSNNVNRKQYNFRVYQYIRENGGFGNWDMIVLETVEYNEKYELKARERHHMETLGATLNSRVPNRNMAEWYVDNPDYKKLYRENNVEHIKQYYEVYYKNNKEAIKEHKKQKHDCECGGKYTHQNKSMHMKTIKHQKHLEQK